MRTYTTVKYQTLIGLAMQLYGNVDAVAEILELNDLTGQMEMPFDKADEVDITANVKEGVDIVYDETSDLYNALVLKELNGRVFVNEIPRTLSAEAEEYIGILSAEGYEATATEQLALDLLLFELMDNGLWDKISVLYPMMGDSLDTCKYNLKDPRDLDAAFRLTFYNSPTVMGGGVKFNGTTQYADTHYVPSTESLPANSHICYYSLNDDSGLSAQNEFGSTWGGQFILYLRAGQTDAWVALRGGSVAVVAKGGTGTQGLWIFSNDDTTVRTHLNGASLGTDVQGAVGAAPTTHLNLGARNGNNIPAGFADAHTGFMCWGEELSADEAVLLSTIVNRYMTSLGKNTY